MGSFYELKDVAVSTRVRLARNLSDYPFSGPLAAGNGEIIEDVIRILKPLGEFNLIRMSELGEGEAECLKEKYIISPLLAENRQTGAVIKSDDERFSVMINEEDHLREQCMLTGLRLEEAYNNLRYIDKKISERMKIAKDESFGYITACMTNIGTGMRASVMLFLPALTESGRIEPLIAEMKDLGLTIRGAYGEGSSAEGRLYQISNEVTLGYSEEEILKIVGFAARKIAELEASERNVIYRENPRKAEDECRRAFGTLANCRILGYDEFAELYVKVRLGSYYGFYSIDVEELDRLFVSMRPAVLAYEERADTAEKRDNIRADIVSYQLSKQN